MDVPLWMSHFLWMSQCVSTTISGVGVLLLGVGVLWMSHTSHCGCPTFLWMSHFSIPLLTKNFFFDRNEKKHTRKTKNTQKNEEKKNRKCGCPTFVWMSQCGCPTRTTTYHRVVHPHPSVGVLHVPLYAGPRPTIRGTSTPPPSGTEPFPKLPPEHPLLFGSWPRGVTNRENRKFEDRGARRHTVAHMKALDE